MFDYVVYVDWFSDVCCLFVWPRPARVVAAVASQTRCWDLLFPPPTRAVDDKVRGPALEPAYVAAGRESVEVRGEGERDQSQKRKTQNSRRAAGIWGRKKKTEGGLPTWPRGLALVSLNLSSWITSGQIRRWKDWVDRQLRSHCGETEDHAKLSEQDTVVLLCLWPRLAQKC